MAFERVDRVDDPRADRRLRFILSFCAFCLHVTGQTYRRMFRYTLSIVLLLSKIYIEF